MSLLPDQRQVLDDLIAECYENHGPRVRPVAVALVSEMNDLAGSGAPWVGAVLDDWLITGANQEIKSWMRRQPPVAGATKRGKATEVPAFGGVRILDDEGRVEYVQLRLLSMTRDELRAHVAPKRKQRDTISRSLSFYEAVLADMEAHDHAVVADAVECIGVDGRQERAS